jgi:hypothetical protein
MRIFIDHFNLDALPAILSKLSDHLVKTETYTQVYSIDGVYRIDSTKITKLTAVDSNIEILKDYYSPFTLIVDRSYFTEETSNVIDPYHIFTKINRSIFEINKNSNIKLVIEGMYVEDHNIFHKSDSFNMVPNNIYFEGANNLDITDALVKKELIEFLSLLN